MRFESGATILILSDRQIDKDYAPIPSLLATSGLHHHLVREGSRTKATLIVETGDAREVHHYCLLIGYGASAINPYLAFETLDDMIRQSLLTGIDHRKAVNHYTKAVKKGVLKVMSKMGISTLQSYRGAQIFEAIGLDQKFVETYFTNTPSRIGGIGLEEIAAETIERHRRAFPARPVRLPDLDWGGQYQWRQDGEYHMYNPESIHKLQYSTRTNNYKIFKEYSELMNSHSQRLCTLRGLMDLKFADKPIPLEEVEPVESIMKRFATGAMSFGSISKEAHETLAIAMNRIGGSSNTGEGGEDPARYIPDANGDSRCSAIKQVASARFGVTSEYLVSANELQIKMAQGAKPGEGGQLPGHKVDEVIARVRHSTPGVGLISPPPHHDIYSIEDLAQLIYDLKNSNPRARISVKLVAEVGVGTIAAGVAKAHADVVLISGDSGGTGASPLTSIKHAGIPWELGSCRNASGSGAEQSAQPHHRSDRWTIEDRARRRHRGVAWSGRIWLRHFGADRFGLHHDARLPSEYLPGRRSDAGSGAPGEVHGQTRIRRELLPDDCGRSSRTDGAAWLPHYRRNGRPPRQARHAQSNRSLEGEESWT